MCRPVVGKPYQGARQVSRKGAAGEGCRSGGRSDSMEQDCREEHQSPVSPSSSSRAELMAESPLVSYMLSMGSPHPSTLPSIRPFRRQCVIIPPSRLHSQEPRRRTLSPASPLPATLTLSPPKIARRRNAYRTPSRPQAPQE